MVMNKLPLSKRVAVVSALVEGNSLRSTCRMTGVAMNTVLKLLAELGAACADLHDAKVRDVDAVRVQCDEIWQFVGAKAKNVTDEQKIAGWGDCWTWTAIDADTKLIISYEIGARNAFNCYEFMKALASRLTGRVQLSTDGLRWYHDAVDHAFGIDVDYATITKVFGKVGTDPAASVRYSPAKITGTVKEVIRGNPDDRHISTSYVERQNLTMRMSMRRFTRLTNGFSKKIENHMAATALHFAYYNFCRVHQTLRVTPAMEARLTDRVWSIEDLVSLLDRRVNLAA
jgi:IS1 family transposase